MKKNVIIIIIIVIVVLAVAFAAWYFTRKKNQDNSEEKDSSDSSLKNNIINIRNGKGKIIGEKILSGKGSAGDKKDAIVDAGAKIKIAGIKLPGLS
ncbi:MAG TPA: hypothetical protein PLB59_09770 [Bacteroidales bacterium]|jgi:uncharacterized alpha/beta hydrolase family protein|nr:hypothetical protein [Bacteroidales bacterium]HQN16679.1 hypothetical protein [Bacteroidales bacterium]HQP16245.1 hypothetical protein [Bacteroidales bacterium]